MPGLDGNGKMGKSEGNGIYLVDSDADIRKKVMKALTDGGPTEPNMPMCEGVKNLFTMLSIVSDKEVYDHFLASYNDCTIRYGDLKKQLAEDIIKVVAPIRERIADIQSDDDYLRRVVRLGAEKARESAAATVKEVRRIMGFKPF